MWQMCLVEVSLLVQQSRARNLDGRHGKRDAMLHGEASHVENKVLVYTGTFE